MPICEHNSMGKLIFFLKIFKKERKGGKTVVE